MANQLQKYIQTANQPLKRANTGSFSIRGAGNTIREKRPLLDVCAYYRTSDIHMLSQLIKQINPDYKIFLRGGLHYAYYAIDRKYLSPCGSKGIISSLKVKKYLINIYNQSGL